MTPRSVLLWLAVAVVCVGCGFASGITSRRAELVYNAPVRACYISVMNKDLNGWDITVLPESVCEQHGLVGSAQ